MAGVVEGGYLVRLSMTPNKSMKIGGWQMPALRFLTKESMAVYYGGL